MKNNALVQRALSLLEEMISIPAPSGKEEARCDFLEKKTRSLLKEENLEDKVKLLRIKNNIVLFRPREGKKTVLLCAHIDTVNSSAPHYPAWKGNRLYGLGANDDGGSVVCMLEAFTFLAKQEDGCQIVLALTAEEENGGKNGIPEVLRFIKKQDNIPMPDYALVGEPTGMKAAVGEKGLLVLDGTAEGKLSHAAYPAEENAVYNALKDIEVLRKFSFRRKSGIMGPTHLSVTQINAGSAHNIVPDTCSFVVDIRFNERYSSREILQLLSAKIKSSLKARNLEHRCSVTPYGCPLWEAMQELDIETYVSPTSSDWARLDIPAVKIGPGESSRSHKANEYITKSEIAEGINKYISILSHPKLR